MVFLSIMKFIADLHIHSRFSRATSPSLDLERLSLWAQKKGIMVVGTGDFTHPAWVSELQEKLAPTEGGFYRLKPSLQKEVNAQVPPNCQMTTRFVLSGEISCIYKKNGKTRKLHHLILMPDLDAVLKLNRRLDRIGNISSDGRPILGLDSKDLLEIVLETSDRAFFIPAHIWTPWFSLFGSKSGFDSIEECFEDLSPHIHALETGLSSDPPMNRRLSALDDYLLVSNSDAHSPGKLGREANIFNTALDYTQLIKAMTDGDGLEGTIEFFPEEGKYHLDGHRKCGICLDPEQSNALNDICPSCGRPMTIGVLNRVHQLSDRKDPSMKRPFVSLIPLPEVLSELFDCGPSTKRVMTAYHELLTALGPELQILMETPLSKLREQGGAVFLEAINRMRQGRVIRTSGYDGQFGTIRLFEASEKASLAGQMSLFMGRDTTGRGRKAHFSYKQTPLPKRPRTPSSPSVGKTSGDALVDPLNPDQREAVYHRNGPLLVIAGPGTGKTLTLTHRIAHLTRSKDAAAEQMLALTFTRKAAAEMADRLSALLNAAQSPLVQTVTFHRLCLDILRHKGNRIGLPVDFILCSEIDARDLATDLFLKSGGDKGRLSDFLRRLPALKAQLVLNDLSQTPGPELLQVCREYQRALRDAAMLDMDDLEIEARRLLREHPDVATHFGKRFQYIFVDEYQDTNPNQVALLKCLVEGGNGEICAIGDADQAIYGFRGADVTHFREFEKDFPGAKRIVLTRNYRSTPAILKGSAALMGKKRALTTDRTDRSPIAIAHLKTVSEEAEMVVAHIERLMGGISHFSFDTGRVEAPQTDLCLGFGDIGILYRLNAQGNALEKALKRRGIPYARSGETPLITRHPADIIWRFFQTLRYPGNPYYEAAYRRLIPVAPDDLSLPGGYEINSPVSDLLEHAIAYHNLIPESEEETRILARLRDLADRCDHNIALFLDALSLERGIDHTLLEGDRVALMSLHAAKGLEWEVTFITGCEDRLLPCSLFDGHDESEERRLFYVGMTRARSRLILSHVDRRAIKGPLRQMNKSPFLDRIPSQLCRPLDRGDWQAKPRAHEQLTLF